MSDLFAALLRGETIPWTAFAMPPTEFVRACNEQSLAGLTAAHGLLQSRVARELRMKRTPQLTFEYDPSVERGMRMSQLIDELAPDE